MESTSSISLIGGLAIAVVAWLWLIGRAFQQGAGWGLGPILLPPMGLLFALRHAQQAVGPLVLASSWACWPRRPRRSTSWRR